MALIETVVALGILGIAAVAVVGGLNSAQKASALAAAQAIAGSLAQSQMEQVKQAPYVDGAVSYAAAPLPVGDDFIGYGAAIGAAPVDISANGIQEITVTVTRDGQDVVILRGYKANR
ncbi:MAG: hypothetical protein HY673_26510 [Chloroflexi bacterium]|nr:hypothetical protein [Chloroflexota bacterium]